MGALVSTAILLAGCQENELVKPKETWHKGDNVEFRVRAGYENNGGSDTRTVYTGETYEFDGKTYERVDWEEGDQIRIFCKEAQNPAEGVNYSDYKIVRHENAAGKDYGYLERVNANGSLQWGDPSKEHTFYAFYPSPAQNSQLEMSGDKAKGVVPMEQTPLEITATDGKNFVAKPNMNYAFMTAKAVMKPGSGNEVNLSFKSMVTALELELQGPDQQTVELTDIRISSDTENLTGSFTCDLDKVATDGYPDCTILSTTDDRHTVNVSLVDKKTGNPFRLIGGQTLKVTVFLLPLDDYQALKISLQTAKGIKSHDLKDNSGSPMVIKSHLKNLVQNIQVPSNFKANQWLSHMNDNVLLSQLSIPGSGNSYSYKYSGSGNDTIKYKAQSLDIEHQWNLGVRAFEVTAGSNAGTGMSNFGQGGLIISNNKAPLSNTVEQAVREVYSMLTANPKEFAMMIISYQPKDDKRDGNQFVSDFLSWYNKLDIHTQGRTALFRPGLSIGDVRGKMMFILRPTSVDEQLLSETTLNAIANEDFLVVDGWGTLQDKWKHRGYPVTNQVGVLAKDATDWAGCMESTMLATTTTKTENPSAPSFPTPLIKDKTNFSYKTNHSFKAWAQEWPRVVEKDFVKILDQTSSGWITKTYQTLWVKWRESYNEKLQDAKETFDKSVADKNNQSSVYFNSLCGYFVLEDDNDSWKPVAKTYKMNPAYEGWGVTYGNLITFSERINEDFYRYVLSKSNTQGSLSGPVGVVMINRVGTDDASRMMPNVIISNNFKFPLLTKDPSAGKTNGNTYQSGGDAIN